MALNKHENLHKDQAFNLNIFFAYLILHGTFCISPLKLIYIYINIEYLDIILNLLQYYEYRFEI